jgi:hypothetical protein
MDFRTLWSIQSFPILKQIKSVIGACNNATIAASVLFFTTTDGTSDAKQQEKFFHNFDLDNKNTIKWQ